MEEKKIFSWPFVPNGQFTKEQEELKAAIVLSEFQKYSHYSWAGGLFGVGNTLDYFWGTEFR